MKAIQRGTHGTEQRLAVMTATAMGMLNDVSVTVIGALYLDEVLATIIATRLIMRGRRFYSYRLAFVTLLAGALISSFWNFSSAENTVKAGVGFLLAWAQVFVLHELFVGGGLKALRAYCVAAAIVGIAVRGDFYGGFVNYKLIWAPSSIFLLVALIGGGSRTERGNWLIVALLAVVNAAFGDRSGAIQLLGGFLTVALGLQVGWTKTLTALIAVIATPLAFRAYVDFAGENESTRNMYVQVQALGSDVGAIDFIRAGRAEVWQGLDIALENPLLGIGPWTSLSSDNYEVAQAGGRAVGDLVPAHSCVIGAWHWAGILGLLAVASFGRRMVLVMTEAARGCGGDRSLQATALLCSWGLWNLAFSPIGHIRTTIPLALAMCSYTGFIRVSRLGHQPRPIDPDEFRR